MSRFQAPDVQKGRVSAVSDFLVPSRAARIHRWCGVNRRPLLLLCTILIAGTCGGTSPLFIPPIAHVTGVDRPHGQAAALLATLPVREGEEGLTDYPFGMAHGTAADRQSESASESASESDTKSSSKSSSQSDQGYSRTLFAYQEIDSNGDGCTIRDDILTRDLHHPHFAQPSSGKPTCTVTSGTLADPYTGRTISFRRGRSTSSRVQIDHVVALHNAWESGANTWTSRKRHAFGNDQQNLLAVAGSANREKSDADASPLWLPSHAQFRCDYVARQIGVKAAYGLSVSVKEKNAMKKQLVHCPGQRLVTHYPRDETRDKVRDESARPQGSQSGRQGLQRGTKHDLHDKRRRNNERSLTQH